MPIDPLERMPELSLDPYPFDVANENILPSSPEQLVAIEQQASIQACCIRAINGLGISCFVGGCLAVAFSVAPDSPAVSRIIATVGACFILIGLVMIAAAHIARPPCLDDEVESQQEEELWRRNRLFQELA